MSAQHVPSSPLLAHDRALLALVLAKNGNQTEAARIFAEAKAGLNGAITSIAPHLQAPFNDFHKAFPALALSANTR
jgi:hypothetical protein